MSYSSLKDFEQRDAMKGFCNSVMMDLLWTTEERYDQSWSLLGARGSQIED